jgi:hypothetical protein
MFGQFALLPDPVEGVVGVVVVAEGVGVVVVEEPDAAFAIAAPPPATTPVTTRATRAL